METKPLSTKLERLLRILLVVYLLGIILVSLTPGDFVPHSSQLHMDKVGHFIAYTGLGFLLGLTVKNRNGRYLAVLGAITLGFLLEGGQFFVPGREMSLADGIVNTCGVLFGMLVYHRVGQTVENWLLSYIDYKTKK